MPLIIQQDLWSEPADVYVVTTNSFVRKDGSLVMGRGAAHQAVQKFGTGLQEQAGRHIQQTCGHLSTYGYFRLAVATAQVGIFQVKHHFKDKADLCLIALAVDLLNADVSAVAMQIGRDPIVRMNYPGIGNGNLTRAEVEPLVQRLDHRVTVCFR